MELSKISISFLRVLDFFQPNKILHLPSQCSSEEPDDNGKTINRVSGGTRFSNPCRTSINFNNMAKYYNIKSLCQEENCQIYNKFYPVIP